MESVSWNAAQSYCRAVGMRLPTEAEWEYAARAGSTASRYGDIDRIAWYSLNSNGSTHEVMRKQPNDWDLYDTLGNVWQWTADWSSGSYSGSSETDPQGPSSGNTKILRGGAWRNLPGAIRVSERLRGGIGEPAGGFFGLRCAGDWRSQQETAKAENPISAPAVSPDLAAADLPYVVYPRKAQGVTSPRLLHKVEPAYSEEARKARFGGTVVVKMVVDANGNVARAIVMRGIGLGLDEKAIECVKQWKFAPGSRQGQPVAVEVFAEVNFKLL